VHSADEHLALVIASVSGGVLNPPVRGHRVSRPYWASFAGGIVAHGKNEFDRRRVGMGELIPAFRTEVVGREAVASEQ